MSKNPHVLRIFKELAKNQTNKETDDNFVQNPRRPSHPRSRNFRKTFQNENHGLDYNSDDSVADKDYVPSDTDHDSNDSDDKYISIKEVNKVKKKLFENLDSGKKRIEIAANKSSATKGSATKRKKHKFKIQNENRSLTTTEKKKKKVCVNIAGNKKKECLSQNEELITLEDLIPSPKNKVLLNYVEEQGYSNIDLNLFEDEVQEREMIEIDSGTIRAAEEYLELQPLEKIDTNLEAAEIVSQEVTTAREQKDEQEKNKPVDESATKRNPKKRVKNEVNWKKTKAKNSRLAGSPYTSLSKTRKEMPEKQLKNPCSCRRKCYKKMTETQRKVIFQHYWKLCKNWNQRKQFIVNHVERTVKVRSKVNGCLETDRRKYNYNYMFRVGDETVTVCKVMFLNTLCVGEKFVKLCIQKKLDSGISEGDKRGRHSPPNKTDENIVKSVIDHISSYPSYESHYTRRRTNKRYLGPELNISTMYKQYVERMNEDPTKEVAKEWLYRHLFNTKFNLAFKLPGLDTCDDCDRFEKDLKDPQTDPSEIEKVKEMKEKHLKDSELRYNLKKRDKEESTETNNKRVLLLDLQKCFPTPSLTNTQSFYLRKLWTLNLTIYDATTKSTNNYMWSENIAGRGANEIASCILFWAAMNLDSSEIQEVTTWTDNCAGQNRNIIVVMAYLWIMQKYGVQRINHKFLLKGHTHMECDHVHAMIEKKKKKLHTMEIASPRDWVQFVKTCGGKNPFNVFEMNMNDMKDFSSLSNRSGPLIQRKKNTQRCDFKISDTVWWQFRKEAPRSLFYKTDFNQETFFEVKLDRNVKKPKPFPGTLPNVRSTEKPISSAKYKDLQTLLKWVPQEYHDFYKNLLQEESAGEVPEVSDSELSEED